MKLRDVLRGWSQTNAAAPRTNGSDSATEEAVELHRRGVALRERAQYSEAQLSFTRAIELKHDFAEAHLDLGLVYRDQGNLEDAADCLQLAVHFAPKLVPAWIELGKLLAELHRPDESESAIRRALALDPRHGEAWMQLGNLSKRRDDLTFAIDCYRTAVECVPVLAEAHFRLGFALYTAGRYRESRTHYDAALALHPDFAEAHHNLGLLLLETGHPVDALQTFERALAISPEIVETQTCIAHALRDLGRLDESIRQYSAVLERQPNFADAVNNRCYALLMREDFDAGWAEYERRFTVGTMAPRAFPFAPWRGEPLTGKRVLVYAEQGLGDEIMFASCLPELLNAAGECVIECNTRLAGLFRRSFPRAHVHGANKNDDQNWLAQLPPVDYQTAIGSLPRHFRRSHADFPMRRGYLGADAQRVEYWGRELAARTALRIGIAWRGGSLRSRRLTRSIDLPLWLPLLRQRDVAFYVLQYGDIAAELAELSARFGISIQYPGNAIDDLDELAAIIGALDLVISVDNTVAHLAGALGQAVWTLLPFSPEWRYPRRGETMPWYPSARLFRQWHPRDWATVIDNVALELRSEYSLCLNG